MNWLEVIVVGAAAGCSWPGAVYSSAKFSFWLYACGSLSPYSPVAVVLLALWVPVGVPMEAVPWPCLGTV